MKYHVPNWRLRQRLELKLSFQIERIIRYSKNDFNKRRKPRRLFYLVPLVRLFNYER